MRRRRIAVLAPLLTAMVIPVGYSGAAQAAPASPIARPAALSWSSCGSGMPSTARCSSVTVPKDWGDRSVSGTYRIALARIPAGNPSRRIGVLTFNPGGPGSAAVDNISWVYSLLPKKIRQRFDLVAWDPRGVGRSEPGVSGCTMKDVAPPATGPVDWVAWSEKYMRVTARGNAACLAANRSNAPYLGTWQIAHDIDFIRESMGESTLTFWGMSYGTTVGRAYAQLFPQRVRALLLDGTVSPKSTIESWAREHTWDDPAAINIALAALGPRYERRYERVMATLNERTLPDGSGGRITRWEVGASIIAWASFQTTWGNISSLLDRLTTAARTSDARAARSAARLLAAAPGVAKSYFDPQWTYVDCADMPDRPSATTLAAIAEAGAQAGGMHIGQSALREGAQCSGMPALGRPLKRMTTPLRLTTPPLVANAIGDNRTPWTAAEEAVSSFTGAQAVQYGGTHHIIYGRTSTCVARPITRYLVKLTLPGSLVTCPLEW